ncbi:MAG: hypothetical protein DRP82_06490, partial [Planctomycetota bacterium]
KQFDLTVKPAGSLAITTTSLPNATEGVSYSATIEATGGTTPYTWTVSGLPSGLSWSQVGDTVEISGTPDSGTAGTYSIDVTVTDSSSPMQNASTTLQLVVNSGGGGGTTLKADFEADPTYGKAPLSVTFTDKSTGSPTSWEWDFDSDGTPDLSYDSSNIPATIQYTYSNPGWYTVKLTVSDGTNSDTCVKEMYVLVTNRIYYVDGVDGDDANGGTRWNDAFATIGKALSVAGDYDLILVADATYNEKNLDFGGKKTYLKGVDHNTGGARPVIDCQNSGAAFYFDSGETEDSVIDNFEIKDGKNDDGGAIYIESNSNPTIINCTFTGNSANSYGGAIYCYSSSPTLTNCIFSDNNANWYGGAIYCDSGTLTVTNCTFSGNSTNWYGGAIYCYHSTLSISNCTFNGNSANDNGGAVYCYRSTLTLNNSILWGDTATNGGSEIFVYDSGSSCTLNYCCVDDTGYGGQAGSITENNCIHSDPKFACAEAGVPRLKHDSPCIDAGDDTLVPPNLQTDILGYRRIVDGNNDGTATVDIGACEVQGIIYVDGVSGDDANSGADWSSALKTIGAGLSAADDGWIVAVADATYNETDLNFNGKKIYLEGVGYHTAGAQPVIDCQQAGRAFYFGSGETKYSVVDNFVIQNGRVTNTYGGAVVCENDSSPVITNCVFKSNEAMDTDGTYAGENGGAIYCDSSVLSVINCTFSGNSASWNGGAIYCNSSTLSIINCTFSDSTVDWYGGAIYCDSSTLSITNCIFCGNSATDNGGAVYCLSSTLSITNCTFNGNSVKGKGGAIYCYSSSLKLNNCILWGDSASSGSEIYARDSGSSCRLNYCCVDNSAGAYGGNGTINESSNCIHSDPQFVDAAGGDYHLKDTSPCIDAGDNSLVPSGVDKDLDGNQRIVDGNNDGTSIVDIGAYEYQP